MQDKKKPNSILTWKHFQQQEYKFNNHVKYIIRNKLVSLSHSHEKLRGMLTTRKKN